jgi:urease accessory protein
MRMNTGSIRIRIDSPIRQDLWSAVVGAQPGMDVPLIPAPRIEELSLSKTPGDAEFALTVDELRLMHLADSALPIGSLAHSFGLESLVARKLLSAARLAEFLRGYLEEAGVLEAVFCREASRIAQRSRDFAAAWVELNEKLSARKAARESRIGSASLGKNFLMAVAGLEDFDQGLTAQNGLTLEGASYRGSVVREALRASRDSGGLMHHCTAFGLACGMLGIAEDRAVGAFLHQTMANLISACQRLMPLGQSAATKILWELKMAMIEAAKRSAKCSVDDVCCFMPVLEWGAMEHPGLMTRLFIS